jgi:hypothetical protein
VPLESLTESAGERDGGAGGLERERMVPRWVLVLGCAPGHPEGMGARASVRGVGVMSESYRASWVLVSRGAFGASSRDCCS